MSILLGWCFAVTAILSNGAQANRHETEGFFSMLTAIELQSSGIQRETARRARGYQGHALETGKLRCPSSPLIAVPVLGVSEPGVALLRN
jgi:hypothetical protein